MHKNNVMNIEYFKLLLILMMKQKMIALPERLDEAVKYIKELKMKVEKMEKKECLSGSEGTSQQRQGNITIDVEVQDLGSGLSMLLLSLQGGFLTFSEALLVIEEEGIEIVNASFVSGAMPCMSTIHCSVT